MVAVARDMEEREAFLADVRYRLEQAQAAQKLQYDKHHRHVVHVVGGRLGATSSPTACAGLAAPGYNGQAESPLLGSLSGRGDHQRHRCPTCASCPGTHPRRVPC